MAKKSVKKTAKKAAAAAKKAPAKLKAKAKKVVAKVARAAKVAAKVVAGPKKMPGVPAGMHTAVFNMVHKDSAKAIAWYVEAFGAKEVMRMASPDGKGTWHAEIQVGDSRIFLNDESPMSPSVAPSATNRPTGSIQLYLPNCDATFDRAVKAGAKVVMPLADMFWGDRFGMLVDPFGYPWGISQHVKEMSQAEMKKAGDEFAKQMAAQMANQGHGPHGQQPGQSAQPQHAQPQHAQPQHAQPGHAQPQHAQPQHAQPQHAQPGHAQPQHAQPHAQPGHAQPQHAQPHAQPQHAQPHAQPQHAQPGHAQPQPGTPGQPPRGPSSGGQR